MRHFYVTDSHQSGDKHLVNDMVSKLTIRGYAAYSLLSGKRLSVAYWHGWPEHVLWIQEDGASFEDVFF